jgi:hypothetical protein
MDVMPFFTWLEHSQLGQFAKLNDGIFVIAQSAHLISLALLGGTVLVTDLRLMNVVMRNVPSNVIADEAHRWFKIALWVILASGFFQLAGVAEKCAGISFFWMKMAALATGIIFVFAVKRPLLAGDHNQINPLTLKLVAIASIFIWFTVAACGRWIGFSAPGL